MSEAEQNRVGSSPLTRGKLPVVQRDQAARGLIPAHAGKTSSLTTLPLRRGAHPRSRGENEYGSTQTVSNVGSSPLTRGKHAPRIQRLQQRGLIPAHAGKTPPGQHTVARLRGSSPLTRGKRRGSRRLHNCAGLIPAHAGKTGALTTPAKRCRAHPRSRGENRSIRIVQGE